MYMCMCMSTVNDLPIFCPISIMDHYKNMSMYLNFKWINLMIGIIRIFIGMLTRACLHLYLICQSCSIVRQLYVLSI